MPDKCWLTFREPDGQIRVEILGSSKDFADLVDPSDGAVLHQEPFAMHGGEWRIESVTVAEDLIRIECNSTAMPVQFSSPMASSFRGRTHGPPELTGL